MGIKDQVASFSSNAQLKAKATANSILQIILRLVTGFFIGLTLSLVGQELVGYGSFSVVFITLIVTSLFFKTSHSWTVVKILVFDLFCALVIQLLKMYILIAP